MVSKSTRASMAVDRRLGHGAVVSGRVVGTGKAPLGLFYSLLQWSVVYGLALAVLRRLEAGSTPSMGLEEDLPEELFARP